MTQPILFLDFDGVINFSATVAAYQSELAGLGYVRHTTIPCNGTDWIVRWSAELVRSLNSLKRDTGFEWQWLTTWLGASVDLVDEALGTRSDGYLRWDPDSDLSAAHDPNAVRNARKYQALVRKVRLRPAPFVWVDDAATPEFKPSDFTGELDVPYLLVAPAEDFGIVREHLAQIEEFMRTNSGQSGERKAG
jgi:hypothetical protein